MKQKISEIKKLYYFKALEKIIEMKIEENLDLSNEIDKYKSLIDTENIKNNKLEEFKSKMVIFDESKNLKENKRILFNQNIINYEFNEISLETIKNYLNIIKNINETELNPELEEDIITQVNNYNQELKKAKDVTFTFQN